jgi:hypothetical protein
MPRLFVVRLAEFLRLRRAIVNRYIEGTAMKHAVFAVRYLFVVLWYEV